MVAGYPFIAPDELFAKLGEGRDTGITIVTPNARLAEALLAQFDARQAKRGLAVWETPDILSFGAFVQRLWEDTLAAQGQPAPLLLGGAQEQALWEEVILATKYARAFLSCALAAEQCRGAWKLAHAWRLRESMAREPGNEDTQAFLDWSSRYEMLTRVHGQTDHARLADVVAPLLADRAVRKPRMLVTYAFDLKTPQIESFVCAVAAAGCAVMECRAAALDSSLRRAELPSANDEIVAAAKWARARLEVEGADGAMPRIGVVVPNLGQSRERVRRIFTEVLRPEHRIPGTPDAILPFDISIGLPLSRYPLVHDALLLLRLAGREMPFEGASRIVRSPFLAGADAELGSRARLDAALRRKGGATVNLDALLGLIDASAWARAPILRERLQRLAQFRRSGLFAPRDASQWGPAMSQALSLAGFPGGRTLDSSEYQVLQKWHEVLASFATLARVVATMSYSRACEHLERIAADTLYQPRTRDVPIAVLGVLESAGLEFDHLWVMGLTDDAWPLGARPDAFIPARLQREAGIPEADPTSSLLLDRRITQGWLQAAPEVVVSHARMREDAELSPSPLIAHVLLQAPEGVPEYGTLRDAIFGARGLSSVIDREGPPIAATGLRRGGTGIFKDQSACPFRAFAKYRLASKPVETPQPGLDRLARGTLLHVALAEAWKQIMTRERLLEIDGSSLDAILAGSVDHAIAHLRGRRPGMLQGRLAVIERERLVARVHEWLDYERRRDDFGMLAVERKQVVRFGGVEVEGRIDRIDRLAAGGHAIIDYKSGEASVASWLYERPDDPQLPVYALSVEERVTAIAFAKVKVGACKFEGISATQGLLPNVRPIEKRSTGAARRYADWDALQASWRAELERLGLAFARGDARVDPKDGNATCDLCDQYLVCRIAEKNAGGDDGEGVDE
jgi:ATP-dependent helicase/nuclease subunit B